LERSLAVQLVDRSTHHLTLTDAGTTFAVTVRDAVRRVDDAITSTSAAVPPMRFGHNWSSATHAAAIMRSWNAVQSGRQFRSRRSDERVGGLAGGHVDVALVRGPITDRTLRSIVVDNEQRMAALPANHRLALESTVPISPISPARR